MAKAIEYYEIFVDLKEECAPIVLNKWTSPRRPNYTTKDGFEDCGDRFRIKTIDGDEVVVMASNVNQITSRPKYIYSCKCEELKEVGIDGKCVVCGEIIHG